ncbi:unnamed protein product [Sphagnum jensenii]|uniref:Uncharacterized protein n=1 Tax=Sphagnum jensenii TaxID=128206 RepID=A0ABP0W2F8_9BRYO
MKDRDEFLPCSSGNATTAATVKKKYLVSGFFKVSKYRQEKLSYFVEMSLHLVTCFLAIVNLIASTKYLAKEPTEIPMETIRAVLAMDYPMDCFRILVLDDGGQDDLKASVEALQSESYRKQFRYVH